MSEFVNVPLGRDALEMDVAPQFQPYSGVEIIVDEDTSFFVGSRSGRVLSITNPWGTRAQAQNILALLTGTGFQYQPYTASDAILNPAAELGDAVTLNGIYSGIYKMTRRYDSLMTADIEAPQDEEVDHEYPYEPKQDRVFRREIADAQARISLTQEAISSEVTRATAAEGTLSSRITQTASEISATVSGKLSASGGSTSTFGWSLTNTAWLLNANGSTVFKVTKDGAEISGKITAKSGTIGGFTIGANAITTNGQTWGGTKNGIYLGSSGIQLGSASGSYFQASASGTVKAHNMTLTGTLNIGGQTITAAQLRSGAQSAYNNGSYWSGGGSAGTKFNNMGNLVQGYTIWAKTLCVGPSGTQYWPGTISFIDGNGNARDFKVLMTS